MKVFMDPNPTDTQLEAVDQILNDATGVLAAWTYLDADASLQEAERVLADQPGAFDLLDAENVPTTFNLVAVPAAPTAPLRQLADELKQLPGGFCIVQDLCRNRLVASQRPQREPMKPHRMSARGGT